MTARTDAGVTTGTGWLAMRERGSTAGMYFIVACHRLLGRRLCAYLIVPVVGYFFLTGRAARQASRRYLLRLHQWAAHGDPGETPSWRASLRHFYEFGLNILDRVSFFAGDTAGFRTVVHGRELLERMARAGRGALVLSAHLGSFDALRLVADEGGVALSVAMFLRNAPRINAVFQRLNAGRPLRIIDLGRAAPQSVFAIRACLQRGEFVGMLADRVGTGDDGRVARVRFLGAPAVIPQGPFALAAALKCPVLLMIALRVDHRTYEVFVELLADDVVSAAGDRDTAVETLARRYASRLERYCGRAPYQWFNFYDFWDEGTSRTP